MNFFSSCAAAISLVLCLGTATLAATYVPHLGGQGLQVAHEAGHVEIGSPAPAFSLDGVVNQEFKKISLDRKSVV